MQVEEVVKSGHARPTIGSGVHGLTTCLLIIDKRHRVYVYPYIYAHGNKHSVFPMRVGVQK
jgi:hypothetical protein